MCSYIYILGVFRLSIGVFQLTSLITAGSSASATVSGGPYFQHQLPPVISACGKAPRLHYASSRTCFFTFSIFPCLLSATFCFFVQSARGCLGDVGCVCDKNRGSSPMPRLGSHALLLSWAYIVFPSVFHPFNSMARSYKAPRRLNYVRILGRGIPNYIQHKIR